MSSKSMRVIGRTCQQFARERDGNYVTFAARASADALEPGDVVRFAAIEDPRHVRPGQLIVTLVDAAAGVAYFTERILAAIPTAAEGDFAFVEREPAPEIDADIVALEAYLASCVRRRDWHGVSDAANDLRVLEARREAARCR